MKNYALLDNENIVINITQANSDWSNEGWIEYTNDNPAFIGGNYIDGFFYSPQPYKSWTRQNGNWIAPTPMPIEGIWFWSEEKLQWQSFGN
jgi:hypothetical protein